MIYSSCAVNCEKLQKYRKTLMVRKTTIFCCAVGIFVFSLEYGWPEDRPSQREGNIKTLYMPSTGYGQYNDANRNRKTNKECTLCQRIQHPEEDEKNLVIKRDADYIVMMNLYPYASGHLLLIPTVHVDKLEQLTTKQQEVFMQKIIEAAGWLQELKNPDGFNIGINLGTAAGASIPDHVHWHIVPRSYGDTGFITTQAGTIAIRDDMQKLYAQLREIVNQKMSKKK